MVFIAVYAITGFAQPGKKVKQLPASRVDFDAYETLAKEVEEYRKDRLISLYKFLQFSKAPNTIILDTRSTEMYNRKYVKGAIHLNFSDFTQDNLRLLIPDPNTRILIYCNNNFDDDAVTFATKSARPRSTKQKEITLALNIPTFINLYGYGYKNVYELADLVSVFNKTILFEGTDVKCVQIISFSIGSTISLLLIPW
jgi:rhodanese-related sulfurtransferase